MSGRRFHGHTEGYSLGIRHLGRFRFGFCWPLCFGRWSLLDCRMGWFLGLRFYCLLLRCLGVLLFQGFQLCLFGC
jgi:hypothetical protein